MNEYKLCELIWKNGGQSTFFFSEQSTYYVGSASVCNKVKTWIERLTYRNTLKSILIATIASCQENVRLFVQMKENII